MTETMQSPFSFSDAFERRLSRALRAAAPGDPPFPASRLSERLAAALRATGGRVVDASPPHAPRFRRRAAAAAAAALLVGAGAAVGVWAGGARPPDRVRPKSPLEVVVPSVILRGAPVDEALEAIADEVARTFPEPENRLRFRFDLPEGAEVPPVSMSARGVDARTLVLHVADAAELDVRTEADGTVVLFPKETFEPGPETRVWCNEWNRDPATRPPVLRERTWILPPALDAATRPAGSAEWRAFFAELGVDWAYGTELAFNAPLGLLRVTHAPEVLDRIDAVLRGVGAIVSEPVAEEESDAP